jgi:hypothetical protein
MINEWCGLNEPLSWHFPGELRKITKNISQHSRDSNWQPSEYELRALTARGLVVRVPGNRLGGPGFDSRRYQIFWEVVGLERGRLSLMSTTEELLGRNSSGFGLENREYGRGDTLHWPGDTFYPQKLALTSPTSGDRSVCKVRLRNEAIKFWYLLIFCSLLCIGLAAHCLRQRHRVLCVGQIKVKRELSVHNVFLIWHSVRGRRFQILGL